MPFLLRTKIEIPPIPGRHVYRERLALQPRLTPDQQLVLVSAPAGFGKSSFLIEWAHHLLQNDTHVAWYALDEGDNDPARFAAYLVTASRIAYQDWQPADGLPEQMGLQDAIGTLINRATEDATPFVCIIDDYHLITEPQVHDAVTLLAEYMPANMRLAIGTRADPPLQLARMRAQGKVHEVRMGDLRFSDAEISEWFHVALGWMPAKHLLAQLDDLTEGWAAALALIMMSRESPDPAQFENQLARYSLAQRHIFDYLMQEIFEQLPDETQAFLLDTCVLSRLHPQVCSVLTGNSAAPLLLNQLASQSLFVIPLSDTEPVYRYHHLFEQFLRQYLHIQSQQHFYEQHRLAADWHVQQERYVEAVGHALNAQDYDYAANLIEEKAWQPLTARGEIATIMHWLPRIPDDALDQHPRLCLYFSRGFYLIGEFPRSEEFLNRAVNLVERSELPDKEKQVLHAIACNYRATLAAYRGEVEAGIKWIEQANDLAEDVTGLDRVRIANTEGFLHYLIGDVNVARRAYQRAFELASAMNHHYLILDAQYYLSQLDLLAGDLQSVQDRCEAILAQQTTKIGPMCIVMLPLAFVYHQRNQIVQAEALLREAIALARRANIPDALWWAHLLLAEVMWARGQVEDVRACIEQAKSDSQSFASPMMAIHIGASEASLALQMGDLDTAHAWAQAYQDSDLSFYYSDQENLTLARIHLARGDAASALVIVNPLIDEAHKTGRMSSVMMGELIRALAHQQQSGPGDPAALAAITSALEIGHSQGVVRIFLDFGQPVQRLLQTAIAQGIHSDYAQFLLDTMDDAHAIQHPADTLTDRELEVLALIAEGASNQDIADGLFISLGTVKSHIHHIMNKLDAQNRTEAVNKARSLHILPG